MERMIQVGEIIGHRYWRATRCGNLYSLWQYSLWQPYIPMTGDINVRSQGVGDNVRNQGVYAWTTLENLYTDRWFSHYRIATTGNKLPSIFTSNWINKGDIFYIIIAGEIELWGETQVHEKGYRASFGYPRRFYKDYKGFIDHQQYKNYSVLEKVSKKYGVELI